MKLVVVLVLLAVCGAYAEPFNPFSPGDWVHKGADFAGNVAKSGLGLAHNIICGIFGCGSGQEGKAPKLGELFIKLDKALKEGDIEVTVDIITKIITILKKVEESEKDQAKKMLIQRSIKLLEKLQADVKGKNKVEAKDLFTNITFLLKKVFEGTNL